MRAPAVRRARGRGQKLAPGSRTCCDGYQVPCRTCGAETGGYARLGRSSCGTCAGRVAPGALSEGAVPPLPLELRGLCEGARHHSAQEGRFPSLTLRMRGQSSALGSTDGNSKEHLGMCRTSWVISHDMASRGSRCGGIVEHRGGAEVVYLDGCAVVCVVEVRGDSEVPTFCMAST